MGGTSALAGLVRMIGGEPQTVPVRNTVYIGGGDFFRVHPGFGGSGNLADIEAGIGGSATAKLDDVV